MSYRLIYKVRGESHEYKDKDQLKVWAKIFEIQEGKNSSPLHVQWYLYNRGGILIHSSLDKPPAW